MKIRTFENFVGSSCKEKGFQKVYNYFLKFQFDFLVSPSKFLFLIPEWFKKSYFEWFWCLENHKFIF